MSFANLVPCSWIHASWNCSFGNLCNPREISTLTPGYCQISLQPAGCGLQSLQWHWRSKKTSSLTCKLRRKQRNGHGCHGLGIWSLRSRSESHLNQVVDDQEGTFEAERTLQAKLLPFAPVDMLVLCLHVPEVTISLGNAGPAFTPKTRQDSLVSSVGEYFS